MQERWMARAIEIALENVRSGRGGPFGAVVVAGECIVGEGVNLVTSSNDPTAHAEVMAIRLACRTLGTFQLTGCEIYASCEPCPMCLGAIYWSRASRLYYGCTAHDAASAGFDDSMISAELRRNPANRRIPTSQVMRREALALFDAWRSKSDKVTY